MLNQAARPAKTNPNTGKTETFLGLVLANSIVFRPSTPNQKLLRWGLKTQMLESFQKVLCLWECMILLHLRCLFWIGLLLLIRQSAALNQTRESICPSCICISWE